jgi:hypothetical protein
MMSVVVAAKLTLIPTIARILDVRVTRDRIEVGDRSLAESPPAPMSVLPS